MRIAAASKDGRLVDLHFGHAEGFLIYDVDEAGFKFVERRKVEKYCAGAETDYSRERSAQIYYALKDCAAVLVSRIGPRPEEELEKMGVLAVVLYDFIPEALKRAYELFERKRAS